MIDESNNWPKTTNSRLLIALVDLMTSRWTRTDVRYCDRLDIRVEQNLLIFADFSKQVDSANKERKSSANLSFILDKCLDSPTMTVSSPAIK